MNTLSRKTVSIISIILLLFGMIVPAAADGIISDSEIVISSAQEQALRNAVETYFEQRNSFLHGVAGSYPAINDWYETDLTKHRTAMTEAEITRLEATLEITDLHIYYKETHVYATEHLVYEKNGTVCREEISHDFLLMESSSGWKVVDDAYYEAASDFASCAYIPPESSLEHTGADVESNKIPNNSTKHCIRHSSTSQTLLSAWSITLTHHSRSCENCGTTISRADHVWIEDPVTGSKYCSICDYQAP